MRGILQGLGLTLLHVTRPKVTRLYPYEKRKLPDRSRGLIQLMQEAGQDTPFNLKCEACLLCEKICPPRAITIEARPTLRFRRRPYFQEQELPAFLNNVQSLIDRCQSRGIPIVQVFHEEPGEDADNPFTAASGGVHADRKSTRLNSSHLKLSRMPSSA